MTNQTEANGRANVNRSEAGRRGDGVRSDVFVSVERTERGGLSLDVTSRAEALYGESIRKDVTEVVNAFGLGDATVTVEDQGALPFVLAARVETALRRLGLEGDGRPARHPRTYPRTERDRLRRSRLYLPGNEPKFMINAALHAPDAVILDLEDSVHPLEKDAARIVVRNALRCLDFRGCERMVRINQHEAGLLDLDAVIPESPDLILIPKAQTVDDVRQVVERIREIQRGTEQPEPIWIMPILESALGIENAFDIARASENVVALTIGLEDYTADLGVRKTFEGDESLYARMRLVNASVAAGLQAIDSVFGNVGDMDALRAWATRSKGMGFEGMGCIHPRQIRPIHESFAPSEAEIEKSLTIVAAFELAQARGLSVVSLGSKMIDPPVVIRAQRLVETARRAGLISDESDIPKNAADS
ncbi:MAG: citrate lyase ACP [Rhodothermales bacterium]|nr:citrate lyase ACP [Rhodothermales bacterium]